MNLYLLRHASPCAQAVSGKDADRPLSIKGFQESALLASFLEKNVSPCEVWCSSSVRTCETLNEINKRWKPLEEKYLPEFYLASKETYLKQIWASAGKEDLLIVGHNFGLSHLLSYLTGEQFVLEPAELVELRFSVDARAEISRNTATVGLHFCPPYSPLEYRCN